LIFSAIAAGALVVQYFFVNSQALGGSVVMNDAFFGQVFMNPLSHLFSFLFGTYMSLCYFKFVNERCNSNEVKNSVITRTMEMLSNNVVPRYILYVLAIAMVLLSVVWQTPFSGKPQDQSQTQANLYATFSGPVFLLGMAMMIMPALAGKAAAFRWVFSSGTFTALSNASIGLYYTVPMAALFYNISTQHQISVNYYMFVYYFTGNLVFGVALFIPLGLFVDKPIQAALNLEKDIEDAMGSYFYKMEDYLANFTEAAGQLAVSNTSLDTEIRLRLEQN